MAHSATVTVTARKIDAIRRLKDYDFYNVQCEDGSREAIEWTFEEAKSAAEEATKRTGLGFQVHGVKVLLSV